MNGESIYTPVFKTNRYVPLWVDRMLRSVLSETQCLSYDRTRPVMIFPLWNLTGVNRTLAPSVRSLTSQRPVTPDNFTLIK